MNPGGGEPFSNQHLGLGGLVAIGESQRWITTVGDLECLTAALCNVFSSKPCGHWWFRLCAASSRSANDLMPLIIQNDALRPIVYTLMHSNHGWYGRCVPHTVWCSIYSSAHDSKCYLKCCPAADCAMHSNRWWYGTYVLHTVEAESM